MKPLEIHVRNRVLLAACSVEHKPYGSKEITLAGKDRKGIYIFRKEMGTWKLAYGELDEDIREACIDAIILRFDDSVAEMFYHDGKRQIVELRPKPGGLWNVFNNNIFSGSISNEGNKWQFYCEEGSVITSAHMGRYITMVSDKKIVRINRDGRG